MRKGGGSGMGDLGGPASAAFHVMSVRPWEALKAGLVEPGVALNDAVVEPEEALKN